MSRAVSCLGLTGGPMNPFSLLYLVQITVSAVVLNKLWTWALTLRRPFRSTALTVAMITIGAAGQVRRLKTALPGIRVGTVDKFQGQQAPVVVFSMTASDGASPRGIEFLFDKNRLNVAISRAQVLAVVVASPKLERTQCARLEQIPLVNMFCRAVHEGSGNIALGELGARVA